MFDKLSKYLNTGDMVRIQRPFPGSDYLYGYLIGLSSELGLMRVFQDFTDDGCLIFRIQDVQEIRASEYEQFWDRVLRSEGLVSQRRMKPEIDLSSLSRAVASVQDLFGKMIIERQGAGEVDEDYYIGIASVAGDSEVLFHNFNALGQWDDAPEYIDYDEITTIQCDTPYLNRLWPYVDPQP